MARKPKAVKRGRSRGSNERTPGPQSANVAKRSRKAMSPSETPATSPVKKTPRKAAPRGKWSEEQLMTSDRSILIDQDLVKLLASPAAWHCLEEAEQREILALLPEDTHPNPESNPDNPNGGLPPLPDSFVRYSNNWRDSIRQFQLDLQNGHYDPDWLRQAEEARVQRENGDFDSFKEREFEQFWGQKQKKYWDVRAGESGRVSLGTLVTAGVVQVGDIWKFEHTFGVRDEERIFVEKEAQVHEITSAKLTFLVPSGRRVFLSGTQHASQQDLTVSPKIEGEGDTKEELPKLEATSPDSGIQKNGDQQGGDQIANSLETDHPSQTLKSSDLSKCTDSERATFMVEVPISKAIDGESPELRDKDAKTPKQEIDIGVNKDDLNEVTTDRDRDPNIEIVISNSSSHHQKRALSQPAVEPPLKRKRGRPRKFPASPNKLDSDTVSDFPSDNPDTAISESNIEVVLPAESKHHFDPASSQSTLDGVILVSSPKTATCKNPMSLDSILESENTQSSSATKSKAQVQSDSAPQLEVTPQKDTVQYPISSPLSSALSSLPSSPVGDTELENAEPGPEHETDKGGPVADGPVADDEPHTQTEHDLGNVIVPDIDTPGFLIKRLMELDGRKAGTRVSNAWKDLRCFRKNQDMGSLWDVRFAWYSKHKNNLPGSDGDSPN